jgi:hypothetical protein
MNSPKSLDMHQFYTQAEMLLLSEQLELIFMLE